MTRIPVCLMLTIVMLAWGCRSNPQYQRTIGMLRAEKLQLEDEYFSLKSKYEQLLAQTGQPNDLVPLEAPEIIPSLGDSEQFESFDDPLGDLQATGSSVKSTAPTVVRNAGSTTQSTSERSDIAQYIRTIEVDLLKVDNQNISLLIRPLDELGEIIPIAGDLSVRLLNRQLPKSASPIRRWNFAAKTVAAWVNDQPDQQPGIQLRLPVTTGATSPARSLLVQYRTADDRWIQREVGLPASDPSTPSANSESRSDVLLEADAVEGVVVEIGDEANFESLDSSQPPSSGGSSKPPAWKPDR